MSELLSVRNLNVKFGERTVLQDFDFVVEKGSVLAVIGPNGSGKTVLLKALLGIIPYSGEVSWAPGTKIGYVPQKIDADIHLPVTIENLLQAKARIMKLGSGAVEKASAQANLTRAILKTPMGHLSGGNFQKALIAFALLGDPNVILFDEPTASLDQLAEEHVYDLIHELQAKQGLTVILVSHELSVVNEYATQVLCVNREKICFGVPRDVLTPEVLKELYSSHKHHEHKHD